MDILAIDAGFGFTKATNGNRSIIFKSILGEATDIQFKGGILAEGSPDENIQIEIEGQSYFIGEMAERQSNVRSFTLDPAQFFESHLKPLTLAAVARLVSSSAPIRLVTGLPIGYLRDYSDRVTKALQGEHTVVLTSLAGKREEKTIVINEVKVIPEPFGSLFNLIMNDLGEQGDKRYANEKIGIIDIGFKTADFTITDRMRYSERGSRTTDSGIAKAFSLIADKLREKSNVNIELYRLYDAVEKGSIRIKGKEYDLRAQTEMFYNQLAASIADEVDRLWSDEWDIDTIVLTGGGGAALAKYLQPLIDGQVITVDPGKDPRLWNVRGYWKYAKHLWGRPATAATAATGTAESAARRV